MKLSSKLLGGLGILTIAALLSANISIKTNYDLSDKDDFYWGYAKILEQPFKHIKIKGGNITQIAFEQNEKPSVRVLKQWPGYESGSVRAFVRADTLFVDFPKENPGDNPKVKDWIKHTTLLRVFAPELLSVDGLDTDFDLTKLRQKNIVVNLSGRSEMEIESSATDIDSLKVIASDSSSVSLEASPEATAGSVIKVRSADIQLRGTAKLDLGTARLNALKLTIEDSALINLSGFSVNKIAH